MIVCEWRKVHNDFFPTASYETEIICISNSINNAIKKYATNILEKNDA